ncbi:MAG: preprotein translocase subunit SecG [Isosphaeraceae bacterium]
MLSIITAILNTLVVLVCIFLICLILIQRGKGGGLAGAFGGTGGSSAFGTKAGDVFTRVTVIVAFVWIIMSMFLVVLYNAGGQSAWGDDESPAREVAPKKAATAGTGDLGTVPPAPTAPGSTIPAPVAPGATPATTPAPTAPVSVPAIPGGEPARK